MENIYGQTEQERNSIVQIPDKFAENAGNVLYSWLGSLWRSVHRGDGMIRGLHAARGIRRAQLYLDILESLKLQDRNGAPVFHRELWHPIVVRLSKRDTAQENMLSVGMDGEVGPQPEGSVYGEGTVFSLGRLANFKDYVTYPVDAKISGGALTIVDNVVNPSVSMERGKDYEIGNDSIIFHRSNDPLGESSRFDRYDVPGLIDDDGNEVPDMEAVLWASDVLIDRNYVSDHLSYALGADAPSSDLVKRILNAAWSSVASGLTPELAKTLVAAMLNIPVIQNEKETVLEIYVEKDEDGNEVSRVVETDKGTYRVSLKARLLPGVRPGAVMTRGDLLDESVRIYPFLNGISCRNKTKVWSNTEGVTPHQHTQSSLGMFLADIPDGSNIVRISLRVPSGHEESYSGTRLLAYLQVGQQQYPLLGLSKEASFVPGSGIVTFECGWNAVKDTIRIGMRIVGSDGSSVSRTYYYFRRAFPSSVLQPLVEVEYVDPEDPSVVLDHVDTGFSVPLQKDIPSVVIPSSMIRARTEYGVYAMWGMEEVKKDSKGRLYFDVGGTKEDVSAFWEDVWARAKEAGADMEAILGPEGTRISPAAFFLQNLVGANTLFVVVDRAQVDDASMMRNPMFFDMLSSVVPSAIRLFLVEHRSVGDDDVMDMADAAEDESVAAALPEADDLAAPSGEMVSMRFFRPPPAHVRGAREEE